MNELINTITMSTDTITLHLNAQEESAPWGIDEVTDFDFPFFTSRPLKGNWVRVFPKTAKDVMFLKLLDHRVEKMAPAHGHGVLVRAELLHYISKA